MAESIREAIDSETRYLGDYCVRRGGELSKAQDHADKYQALLDALADANYPVWPSIGYRGRLNFSITVPSFAKVSELARIIARHTGGFDSRDIDKDTLTVDLQNALVAAHFYIGGADATCKRVKVGTKTVEQDVFEIQCGDLDEAMGLSDLDNADFGPGSDTDAAGLPPLESDGTFN